MVILGSFFVSILGDFFIFFQNRKKKLYFTDLFLFCSPTLTIPASLILKQRVLGLQAFAFCILTFNDEHTTQT